MTGRDARAEAHLLERLWYADGFAGRSARLALLPLEALYGAVVLGRGALYDAGLLRSSPTSLPAVSVGNLTVGGTGKTPVAAWFASELARRGARPAILLRGYGSDELLVHERLNPGMPVIAALDRVAGSAAARERGANVVVLDDAFQHRRAKRLADVVLVSADRWTERRRHLLPAGPWREPLGALRRASLLVVTRKAVETTRAQRVLDAARHAAPLLPAAVIHLAPGDLVQAAGPPAGTPDPTPIAGVGGRRVFAVSAVGDAGALHAQLVRAGARLDPPPAAYPDHYAFTPDDAATLAREAERADYALCTLKDAVKLAPIWPRAAPPLWYVSQRVAPERGAEALEALLARLLAATQRPAAPLPARDP